MADKKISQLTAGTPPYAAGILFEVSIPDGGGGYNSRSVRQDGLSFTLGSTQVALSGTITTISGLTLSGASVWSGGTIPVNKGGTGQTSYTDGQLLIGNSTGNTLAKGSLTAPAAGFTITVGAGSITFALSDDLAAIEGLSGTGLAARTSANNWALRTLTGTANRLTVTNGAGIAGNPTLDISVSYVGQATITTLGTIGTGVWQGTVITGLYGGTGVANTGKTITLGGSLVTSGAFGTTITVTATTNSTLPSGTHTLAGLDVAQTWSANQQFNSGNFLLKGSTSGTLTVKPADIAGTNTLTLPAGTTDFSATGGTGQFVKQASAGTALTVAVPTVAELAGLGTGVATALAINVGSAGAPVVFNGALGTPSSGTLSSATGLPISTGVAGLAANIATFLGTPSSANLAAAVTNETGTGLLVFGTAPTLSDPVLPNFTVSTAPLSKANDTFADVTGLSVALTAGKTYSLSGHLTITSSGAGGGIKVTLTASGGLTATSVSFTAANFNATTVNARTTVTALGSAVGEANAVVTDVDIVGAIVVNAAGTITVQAAQNTTDATATVVGINSTFQAVRVN